MSIYQRNNGIWYLKKTKDGKCIRLSLGTKDAGLAQDIYSRFLFEDLRIRYEAKQPLPVPEPSIPKETAGQPQDKTVKLLYEEYLNYVHHKGVSRGTYAEKKTIGKLLEAKKIHKISDITQDKISKVIKVWEDSVSSSSIRKYIASFKAFLNYCIKKGSLERKAYDMLVFPVHRVKVRDYVIEDEHWQRIRDHLTIKKDMDFLLYMETLCQTGCRPGELVGLKKEGIDFTEGTAVIYQSKVKAENTLFLGEELLKHFSKMKAGYLFKGAEEGKEYYGKKFSKLKKHLGLPDKYTLYTFRHTFATKLIQKTGDIHLVSRLLGHSDIKITAKHYINRSSKNIKEALKKIREIPFP